MYSLYYNKSELKIAIKKEPEGRFIMRTPKDENGIYTYNSCYYMCDERKPLATLGNKIKTEWITEQKEILAKLEAMKNFR